MFLVNINDYPLQGFLCFFPRRLALAGLRRGFKGRFARPRAGPFADSLPELAALGKRPALTFSRIGIQRGSGRCYVPNVDIGDIAIPDAEQPGRLGQIRVGCRFAILRCAGNHEEGRAQRPRAAPRPCGRLAPVIKTPTSHRLHSILETVY